MCLCSGLLGPITIKVTPSYLLIVVFLTVNIHTISSALPRRLLWKGDGLLQSRTSVLNNDPHIATAVATIRNDAERAASLNPIPTVNYDASGSLAHRLDAPRLLEWAYPAF